MGASRWPTERQWIEGEEQRVRDAADRVGKELGNRIFEHISRKSSINPNQPIFVPGELGAYYLSFQQPRSVPNRTLANDTFSQKVYEGVKQGKEAVSADARIVIGNIASGGYRLDGGVELVESFSAWIDALKDAAGDYIKDHTGMGADAGAGAGAGAGAQAEGGDILRRSASASETVADGGPLGGFSPMGNGGDGGRAVVPHYSPTSPDYSPTSPTCNEVSSGSSAQAVNTGGPVFRRDWGKTYHPKGFFPGFNVSEDDEEAGPPGGPGQRVVAAGGRGDGDGGGDGAGGVDSGLV